MEFKLFQCNGCKKKHYSLEGVFNCSCRFKTRIKWNTPTARTKELRAIMNGVFIRRNNVY